MPTTKRRKAHKACPEDRQGIKLVLVARHEILIPGGGAIDYPAFYSYAYPMPEGFRSASVRPEAAFFSQELCEFVLPYDAVRTAASPDTALLYFLQSTYEAAADAGKWDRAALECAPGIPGVPRAIS
jgi:hypothetical protein